VDLLHHRDRLVVAPVELLGDLARPLLAQRLAVGEGAGRRGVPALLSQPLLVVPLRVVAELAGVGERGGLGVGVEPVALLADPRDRVGGRPEGGASLVEQGDPLVEVVGRPTHRLEHRRPGLPTDAQAGVGRDPQGARHVAQAVRRAQPLGLAVAPHHRLVGLGQRGVETQALGTARHRSRPPSVADRTLPTSAAMWARSSCACWSATLKPLRNVSTPSP
jgi:hypothetical protein